MKHWFNKNYRTLIISAFLIPIIIVAFVSISHVTTWYDISNPVSWSMYLSIGIEIAALSSLAAISANMGRKVYLPFAIVTLVQFIGNIFFSYQFIDINSKLFKDWVDLVAPLISLMGVDENDLIGHKRFLALFSGGLLPLISLSFLHMLVKFTEEDRMKEQQQKVEERNEKLEQDIRDKVEKELLERVNAPLVDAKDIISEVSKVRLSEEELDKLENILSKKPIIDNKIEYITEDIQQNINDEIIEKSYDSSIEEAQEIEIDNSYSENAEYVEENVITESEISQSPKIENPIEETPKPINNGFEKKN
jgi:uncharacterized membrane protein YesL